MRTPSVSTIARRSFHPAAGAWAAARRAALVLGVGLSTLAAAAGEKLLVATCNYAPYFSESMTDGGPVSTIMKQAFEHMGYQVELDFCPWPRALALARNGHVEVLMGVWPTKERASWMAFTDPVLINETGLYKLKSDELEFKGYGDLKRRNIVIGTTRGYAYPKGIDENGLTLDLSPDDEIVMRKLLGGRLRVVLMDRNVGMHIVRKIQPDKVGDIAWLVTLEGPPLTIGIPKTQGKDWEKILKDFNLGLAHLKKNGTLAKILAEYDIGP